MKIRKLLEKTQSLFDADERKSKGANLLVLLSDTTSTSHQIAILTG